MYEKLAKCPNFTQYLPEKYFTPIYWRGRAMTGANAPYPPVS